ncbi:MAG: alanine/glycine:cation symporter family protein [Bacteroidia bacterium]|nr:alanine/glycine:cation symporter family protein [Bacteroidia bacterium]
MKDIVSSINDIIWSPALVVLLVCAGLYFSIGTRFVQVRRIGCMARILFPHKEKKKKSSEGISSFEAFCLALSGRVGTGNIVGVATAIAIGGPGAVFWMWVVAFLGASTAFVESTLAQLYKFKHNGIWRGGPMAYISHGLHCRWLGMTYAVATIIGSGILSTTVQANGMAGAMANAFTLPPVVGGIILALLIGLVIIGGIRRISKVASIVTPFMAAGYIIISLIVLAFNWRGIPSAFGCIVTNAFGINPLCGGILGSTIAMGVKRGLFSNEAGQGTGAFPSASADVDHPAQQGLAQAFSVYIDTLLVCTATALMIITTGSFNIVNQETGELLVSNVPELGNNYVAFTQHAVDSVFGGFGSTFVCISLIFFVFTTVMAYYLYSETSLLALCRNYEKKTENIILNCFKVLFIGAIIFGALNEADLVWTMADIGVGTMAWINVVCILLLSPQAFKALRDYEGMLKK